MANIEIWMPVNGTENFYSISSLGKIKGRKRGRLLSPILLPGQYAKVNLCVHGIKKKYDMHRLMAEHFIPNPENKPIVNHLDGNKYNYFLWNLEWSTHSENTYHYYRELKKVDTENILGKICEYAIPLGITNKQQDYNRRSQLKQMIQVYASRYHAAI